MAGKKDLVKDKDRFSILVPSLDTCVICGTKDRICLHEVFHGPSRNKSKEDGMILSICFNDHQGTFGVHNNPKLDEKLKAEAEKVWIMTYANDCETDQEKIKKFISRYGKNYLDEDDLKTPMEASDTDNSDNIKF